MSQKGGKEGRDYRLGLDTLSGVPLGDPRRRAGSRLPQNNGPRRRVNYGDAMIWGGAGGIVTGVAVDLMKGYAISNGQEIGFMTPQSIGLVVLTTLVGIGLGYSYALVVNSRNPRKY